MISFLIAFPIVFVLALTVYMLFFNEERTWDMDKDERRIRCQYEAAIEAARKQRDLELAEL